MPVTPPPPRHTTEQLADRLIITIPSRRYWFAELFQWFFVVIWVASALFFLYYLVLSPDPSDTPLVRIIMLVGIAFLSAFATFYARALLQTYGREVVEITNQSITIRRAVLGLGAPREYLADSVQALRLVTSNTALDHPGLAWTRIYGFPFLRVGTGWLAFDYGARTFRFGNDIEEAEAKQIIAEIQQKYPQYKD